jgi:hypothetical protein
MAGAQLLNTRYREGWPFIRDASQVVTEKPCRREAWRTLDESLAHFPREAFDYVWLIDPPLYDPAFAEDLRPVWRSGTSMLFKVERPSGGDLRKTPSGG